jgi:uncharacterized OB-fold protein
MTTPSTVPDPQINPETEPYWAAANDEVLLLGHCHSCGEHHHYPRHVCPLCGSSDIAWVPASGTGTIYSHSTLRRADPPYVLAWIQLDEGVGLMTNIVDCDVDSLAIGQPVAIVFVPSASGQNVPMATPVGVHS